MYRNLVTKHKDEEKPIDDNVSYLGHSLNNKYRCRGLCFCVTPRSEITKVKLQHFPNKLLVSLFIMCMCMCQ